MKLVSPFLSGPLDFRVLRGDRRDAVGMLTTGAKVYAQRKGCVVRLWVSGYLPGDADVPREVRCE